VTVAETLLYTDPEMELPLWLVQMFKVTFLRKKSHLVLWRAILADCLTHLWFRCYTLFSG
jgi:hypothetical protein